MRRRALAAGLASALLAACAPLRRTAPPSPMPHWSGRLSLVVRSEPVQSLSASFELQGSVDEGELRLNTPLGNSLAQARWNARETLLQAGQTVRRFDSLGELIQELTGAELPVAALFDWLAGRPTPAAGWQADLGRHAQGRLTAQRLSAPAIDLRIVLDEPARP